MAENPVFERFREISWRRALTDAEQAELEAWLKDNPEFRAEWEAEMALSASLGQLAEPAVPSNFTARVLQAIERKAEAGSRPQAVAGWSHRITRKARWVMGSSFAAAAIVLALVIHQQQAQKLHELQAQRQHELVLADTIRTITKLTPVPNTDVLANFNTIRALNQAPSPDDKLLAALE